MLAKKIRLSLSVFGFVGVMIALGNVRQGASAGEIRHVPGVTRDIPYSGFPRLDRKGIRPAPGNKLAWNGWLWPREKTRRSN